MKKVIFFSIMCLMAMAITSCDKDSTDTSTSGGNTTPAGYVDLGLPSGTKWNSTNETKPNDTCDFYTYDEAIAKFSSSLPTDEQLQELIDECDWTWNDAKIGYDVLGSNGNSIFLPAKGYRDCSGSVERVGTIGYYWSSTPGTNEDHAWCLLSNSDDKRLYLNYLCAGLSVRLVK